MTAKVVLLDYRYRLLWAALGFLVLHIAAANLAWMLRTPRGGRLGRMIQFLRRWGSRLWIDRVLRSMYYLLTPYLLLRYGWASPLDLGLADLDWIRGTGMAVAAVASALAVLLPLWWQYARLTGRQPTAHPAQWVAQPWGWALVLREAVFLEVGWAVCRAPMLLLAGPYLGCYWGLAAVLVAGLLNPWTRLALAQAELRPGVVLTVSLAVLTATLYVFTHNLWLCVATHYVLRLVILRFARWVAGKY